MLRNSVVRASDACRDGGGEYLCPRCGEVMILRCGRKRIPHFAHKSGRYHGEPETFQHELMKSIMEESLSRICEGVAVDDAKVRVGDSYPDVLGINCRTVKGLVNIVCEVQYSNIDSKEVKARTITYSREGYYTLWVFNSSEHRKWDEVGHMILGAAGKKLILWMYHGKVYFLDHNTSMFGVYVPGRVEGKKTRYKLRRKCWGRFPEDFVLVPDTEVVDDRGVKYEVKVLKVFCRGG